MRFNSATGVFLGLSLCELSFADPPTITDACEADVVMQAAQEGILDYVMKNCAVWQDGKNYFGEDVIEPGLCLSRWIADHPLGTPIPNSGDCRTTYQALVDGAPSWSIHSCNIGDGKITMDHYCYDNGGWVADVLAFQTASGHYIGGQQCLSVTVRSLSDKGAYAQLVDSKYGSGTATPSGLVDISVDGGNSLCYGCYEQFFDTSLDTNPITGGITDACAEDPESVGCFGSTLIQNALAEFKKCSGGFDLIFEGNVCSQEDIDQVQQLIPSPYFTLSHCAYNHREPYCEMINSYIGQIQADSDSSCVVCYQDFYNQALLYSSSIANEDIVTACTGVDDVWSKDCIVAQSTALLNFKACSGFDLGTAKSSPTAPVVSSTTDAPTTADTDTTEEPVDETTVLGTTKGSGVSVQYNGGNDRRIASSAVILVSATVAMMTNSVR